MGLTLVIGLLAFATTVAVTLALHVVQHAAWARALLPWSPPLVALWCNAALGSTWAFTLAFAATAPTLAIERIAGLRSRPRAHHEAATTVGTPLRATYLRLLREVIRHHAGALAAQAVIRGALIIAVVSDPSWARGIP